MKVAYIRKALVHAFSFSIALTVLCYTGLPQDKPEISVKIKTDLVTLPIIVTDRKGDLVNGLKQGDFNVYDEGTLQKIALFSVDDAPVSVIVVFDSSGSMSGKKIDQARQALARFVETSHPRDEFVLIGFNSHPQVLLENTRDADALAAKLTYVKPNGETALYDAVYLGVEKVLRGTHPRKVVLVISDGLDNDSRYTYNDVKRQLEESGVVVYAVGISKNMPPRQRLAGEDVLEKLAGISGGRAFFPDNLLELDAAFERIAVELRRQYSIGFEPSSFVPDGKWHRVRVRIRSPRADEKLIVRTRKGYYARSSSQTN